MHGDIIGANQEFLGVSFSGHLMAPFVHPLTALQNGNWSGCMKSNELGSEILLRSEERGLVCEWTQTLTRCISKAESVHFKIPKL